MADLDFKVKNGIYVTGSTLDSASTTFTLLASPSISITIGTASKSINFGGTVSAPSAQVSINGYDIQIMEIMGAWS